MKIDSLFILFFLLCLSCEKRHDLEQNIISIQEATEIEKMLEEIPPNPIEFGINVYLIDKNDNVCQTNFSDLKWLYKFKYQSKYQSLSLFLYNIVNQTTKLDSSDTNFRAIFSKVCPLDKNISLIYQKKGIVGLIDKYCSVKNEKKHYLLKQQKLSPCEEQTISYFFFFNKYFKHTDDYSNTISYLYCPQIRCNSH